MSVQIYMNMNQQGQFETVKDSVNHIFRKYDDVVFVYLFGSQLTGKIGPLSDIDFAVYFNDKLSKFERFDLKLKIAGELSSSLKKDEIDLVILNEAYPLLEHRIVKYGKVIFSRDEKKRIDYEVKAVLRYLDFKPLIEKYVKETLYGRQ